MPSITSREYQTLLAIERWLGTFFGGRIRALKIGRILSPWFFFWIIVGGFFFGFQSYLLIHSLTLPINDHVEVAALAVGVVLGVLMGLIVIACFPHEQTDWKIPMAIFALWMIGPTMFPLLFLVGVLTNQQSLLAIQTASWRPILEFGLFGLGIALIACFYKKITFTQGAVTILLFSFFFIAKVATSNAFYLAGKCPLEVQGGDRAWLSNTRAEIDAYRAESRGDVFYQSPAGQLVCTRTQENLFN